MTIHTALQQGRRLLEDGGIAAPRLTAEVLLAHALQRERVYLYSHPEEELGRIGWIHFGRYLHERLQGKPTQYITGVQEFYGREFRVRPGVFIPRPETEHLIETALRLAPRAERILDAACGSGAIAVTLSLEMKQAVWATDLSDDALAATRENAVRLGAAVHLVRADFAEPFASNSLDLLVSNPPYIPEHEKEGLPREVRDYEPHLALFGGVEGLDPYRALIAQARRLLRPGGRAVFEIGYQQAEAVRSLFEGWCDVEIVADLAGLPRVATARMG
ncbi:MAG TPA: peptide chain release factor N(5)-glutamine methyltransferase [Bryobacteraceae bacterium]|nr:peptide chain release factor N(5)-glutamine methyltransferase [Bryobacteraceae bacterium]